MAYSALYKDFADDKKAFFTTIHTTAAAREKASTHDYGFIATNKMLIEQEFNQLFASLKEDGNYNEGFWLYCYYCCVMLQNYHEAYGQSSKVEEYKKLREKLHQRCKQGSFPREPINDDSFLRALGKKIGQDLGDLVTTPKKISKLREKVGVSNLNRIYWFFCRTTLKNSFLLARDLQWMDKLGNMLGKEIDVDGIIKTLEAPNDILRFLSVGFFAIRFIMNAGMLLKHTIAPSAQEKALNWKQRFSNELVKRHADFLNDLVWGTVNCLTNYNEVFHISAPVAGWVVAGFLIFDVCLILWRRQLAEREYLTKKSQYRSELQYYQDQLKSPLGLSFESQRQFEEHCRLLNDQLTQLEISWRTKNSTYLFNASAALLLMAGFSASMLLTPPVMVLGCYIVCTFAVAMYLSDGAYSKYKEKSLLLEQAQVDSKDTKIALQAYQTARNEFIVTLAKNAIMPTLLIATFAICWQAALVLAAVYIGYELYNSYNKHAQNRIESLKMVEQRDIEPNKENRVVPLLEMDKLNETGSSRLSVSV